MFLAKYDNNGNEQWVKQFNYGNMPYNCFNAITDVIVDNLSWGLKYQADP